jgi:drug/metabolite transporter (DMT)-like permease
MSAASGSRSPLLPLALLAMIGLLWGSFYALIKIGVTRGLTVSSYLFWFTLGTAFLLFVMAWLRGARPPLGRAYFRYCAVLGLVRFALANIFFYAVQARLPVGLMAVVMAIVPIFTYTLALIGRLERLVWRRTAGILLGFAGVTLIVAPGSSLPDPALIPWVLLGLVAPFLHALGYLLMSERSRPDNADSLSLGYGTLLAAALWTLPYAVATGDFRWVAPPFSDGELALMAHMVLAAFNFYAIFELVRISGPTYMSQANSLSVCFGVLFGIAFFDESHSLFVWAAIPLVLAGVALVNMRDRADGK